MMKPVMAVFMLVILLIGCAPAANVVPIQTQTPVAVDNKTSQVPLASAQPTDNNTTQTINSNPSIYSADVLKNAKDSTVLIFSTNQYEMEEAKDAFWFEIDLAKPVYTRKTPPLHWNAVKDSRVWRQGSGTIIDKRGYIITNRIVIEDCAYPCGTLGGITTMTNQSGAQLIYVFLSENGGVKINPENAYIATVVCKNPHEDMAILKITQRGKEFPFLPLGNSNSDQIGQSVKAIGYPADILYLDNYKKYDYETDVLNFNIDTLVKSGETSSLRQWDTFPYNTTQEEQKNRYSANCFQVNVEINRGSCGGPLINIAGEVIGIIITELLYQQGVGYAITINEAKDLIKAALERPLEGISDGAFLSCKDGGYCCSESAILSSPEKRCAVLCNKYYPVSPANCVQRCANNTH